MFLHRIRSMRTFTSYPRGTCSQCRHLESALPRGPIGAFGRSWRTASRIVSEVTSMRQLIGWSCSCVILSACGCLRMFPWGRFSPEALIRSEEHTSELQSLAYLVCRLL